VAEKFITNIKATASSFNGFIFIEHTVHGSIMNQLAQQFDKGQIDEKGLHLEFRPTNSDLIERSFNYKPPKKGKKKVRNQRERTTQKPNEAK